MPIYRYFISRLLVEISIWTPPPYFQTRNCSRAAPRWAVRGISVELKLDWRPWTGSMAVAVWLVGPLGSITWLGSLKSHPGALPTSGRASGPNSPRQGCWLASGSSSSCEGQISPPWATPSQWRDPPALGSGGGGNAVRRPVRLATKEVNSVFPILSDP